MTVDPKLVAFVGVAALLTVLPGADATASALGISALLATSATAFNVMKTVGAAYLVWIGVQALRTARHPEPERSEGEGPLGRAVISTSAYRGPSRSALRMTVRRAFLQGFLTDLLNPKVAIFYLTFLPQFIHRGDPVLRRSLLLASIHIAMGFAWLSAYAWFVDRLGAVLTRPRVKVWLERVTGGVLVTLGARLAWERR